MNLLDTLKDHLKEALMHAFGPSELIQACKVELTVSTSEKFGHYQCNSAMKWAKLLQTPPRELALKWLESLEVLDAARPKACFNELAVAGPGFINLSLDAQYLAGLTQTLIEDPRLGVAKTSEVERVVVDFSSPNIAKEMHVGHLRSTIIGDALARILSFAGHDVLRLNHVGDWGTQFGMLIAYIHQEAQGLSDSMSLAQLMNWYRQAKLKFDQDEAFKLQAQQAVVALQGGSAEALAIWSKICSISRQAYQEIYDLLDIELIERGESFYQPWLQTTLDSLEAKHLLSRSEGALCMQLAGFSNREGEALPLILQKSDGGFNYATTDLTALKHRIEVERASWLIYVIDAGQSLHMQMVFAAAREAQYLNPAIRVDHVAFGLVLGPDGKKFKTRSGETERLVDLIQAAIDKAADLLTARQANNDASQVTQQAHVLGINAIKYADLSCHRQQDYAFSYDKMLRFEGNTAAFLLYAYVRVHSIKRKIGTQDLTGVTLTLTTPAEQSLALKLCQFPEIIDSILKDLMPHRLCDYLYQVSEQFHHFFHNCRVEGTEEQASRLLLCEGVSRILAQGMRLLGLRLTDTM